MQCTLQMAMAFAVDVAIDDAMNDTVPPQVSAGLRSSSVRMGELREPLQVRR